MLKGWRTIVWNILMGSATGGSLIAGIKPEFLAVLAAGWSLGGVILRIITTTPVGQKELLLVEERLEATLGLTAVQVEALIAKYVPAGSLDDLPARLSAMEAALSALRKPVLASVVAVAGNVATTSPPVVTAVPGT